MVSFARWNSVYIYDNTTFGSLIVKRKESMHEEKAPKTMSPAESIAVRVLATQFFTITT